MLKSNQMRSTCSLRKSVSLFLQKAGRIFKRESKKSGLDAALYSEEVVANLEWRGDKVIVVESKNGRYNILYLSSKTG